MKAPGPRQSPVAQASWLIALLFLAWLAFLFIPAPKPAPEPTAAFVKPPPSRLVALGLPDNPDLEHLPEFFALWADHAEWKDDKTIFAYWNPGSNSYSYFFRAIRVNGSYHFNVIPKPNNVGPEESVYDNDLYWSEDLHEECPLRFVYTSKVKVFPYNEYKKSLESYVGSRARDLSSTEKMQVKVDHSTNIAPSPELILPPLDLEQKK